MPTYVFECKTHGYVERVLPMPKDDERLAPQVCSSCAREALKASGFEEPEATLAALAPMRRIFTPLGFIMRPSGWHLKPGDYGYSDFRRELELGEVRTGTHTTSTFVPDEPEKPVELKLPEDQMQEIHELGRTIDRQIREEMPLPQAILDLVPA